jgi:uncharacterized damage-inducible protein DinB
VNEAAGGSIAPFYADWPAYNRRVIEHLRSLSAEDLALRSTGGHDYWPIWAIAAHPVATRVFWLCAVFGEPGAETTPFTDPSGYGWEDDLDHVRSAEEVAGAWESTWSIVQGCLDRWTPEMLGETFRRQGRTGVQVHTRQSILLRLITHEAYHSGEIALIEGLHGRPQLDPWPARDWLEEPTSTQGPGA